MLASLAFLLSSSSVGMKKSVKDVCQRVGVFDFSVSPSQVGITAASAAAYGFHSMFSIVCQVASRVGLNLLLRRCLRLCDSVRLQDLWRQLRLGTSSARSQALRQQHGVLVR